MLHGFTHADRLQWHHSVLTCRWRCLYGRPTPRNERGVALITDMCTGIASVCCGSDTVSVGTARTVRMKVGQSARLIVRKVR